MSTVGLRGKYTSYVSAVRLVTETCYTCSVLFAMTEEQWQTLLKNGKDFWCPNGHRQSYILGKTDEQKLKDAGARETALNDQLRAAIRETALNDQLRAAIREGDAARQETLRIRQRIANGVCPCCTRSFSNLRNHMARQHPDFGVPGDWKHDAGPFRCSCRREFETFKGLRVHQGAQRTDDWDKPGTLSYWSHLTVV